MTQSAAPSRITTRSLIQWGRLLRMAAMALALAGLSGLSTLTLDGGGAAATFASLASLLGVLCGYGLGYRDGPRGGSIRMLKFRIADELAQYRAFTKLLRDQGDRITESTRSAATVIVTGLTEMDANVGRLRELVGDAKDLGPLVDAISAPVIDMLGQLQFQDVTQQQIEFLSRLSLIVDQHMVDLARQLGDRRALDRVGNFKDMFDKALDDCVMSGQRQDHQAAVGNDFRDGGEPKVELF